MRTVLGVKGVVAGEIFGSGPDAGEDAIAELAQERRSPREPYRDSPQFRFGASAMGSGIPEATVHQPSIRALGA